MFCFLQILLTLLFFDAVPKVIMAPQAMLLQIVGSRNYSFNGQHAEGKQERWSGKPTRPCSTCNLLEGALPLFLVVRLWHVLQL